MAMENSSEKRPFSLLSVLTTNVSRISLKTNNMYKKNKQIVEKELKQNSLINEQFNFNNGVMSETKDRSP